MQLMSLQNIIPILLIIAQIVLATNYCDPDLCKGDHIGCNSAKGFHKRCKNPNYFKITSRFKKIVLNAHNKYRNRVASGATDLEAACRMATMQWDNELAELAALSVKQCKMSHDCHNTEAFKYSGQNLAWMTYWNKSDVKHLVEKSVDMWYNEIENTEMSDIQAYPLNGPTIGHFTVMVADKNTHVGCAASTYQFSSDNKYRAFLFACNYATTNMVNWPIYKECNKAGSDCKTGKNPKYTSLCSTSEKYDVNKWF